MLKGKYNHHGMRHTRLYNIYANMKQRCYNKNNNNYENYGERGIIICDEWLKDNKSFFDWANNNGYSDNLTIDRIDVDGNYEPSNCRWVDRTTQNRNNRRCIYLNYNDKNQTIAQWGRELNVNRHTIMWRYHQGWSTKECLFGKSEVK